MRGLLLALVACGGGSTTDVAEPETADTAQERQSIRGERPLGWVHPEPRRAATVSRSETIGLTPTEYAILEYLADATGAGFGLGLAIAEPAARRCSGRLELRNDDDGSTLAVVVLPAVSDPGDR